MKLRTSNLQFNILIIALVLSGLGLIMIYSTSGIYAWRVSGDQFFFLRRSVVHFVIGLVAMFLVMSQELSRIQRFAKPFFLISLILLGLVLIPGVGHEVGGARRWLSIGPFNFQPSEFAKVGFIVYLSGYLARKQHLLTSFTKGLLAPLIAMGLTMFLVLLEPDLGATFLIAAVGFFLIYLAGVKLVHLAPVVMAGMGAFYFLIWGVSYRRARIMTFLNPWDNPQGTSFQLIQSLIAFSSGGLKGVGLGGSHQKLFFLPAAHTDFIFSIIAEELGWLGVVFVTGLFVYLIVLAIIVANRCENKFGYFLGWGIAVLISLQFLIHAGVCTGALPTKGLSLPFISYGGTSLVVNLILVGLLLNISRYTSTNSG